MISYYLFGGIVILFPAAAYLLYLAVINGRPHPTIISGPWDFVGVLFATSGFWLVGGPATLVIFQYRWGPVLVRGDTLEVAGGWSLLWVVVWVGYFVLVVGGSAWLLWLRRSYTTVYNVEMPVLETALARVFDQLGVTPARVGNRYVMHSAAETANSEHVAARPHNPSPWGGWLGELRLDLFPAAHNVVLCWSRSNQTVRGDVEAELARQLAGVETAENPASGWLLTVSSCLFCAIFLGLLAFILLLVMRK